MLQRARGAPFPAAVGLAWFDDAPAHVDAPGLRAGGLPLLGATPWPECKRCRVPMVFRAQVPLALSCLVPPDDDRLVCVFECHAETIDGACHEGTAVVVSGAPEPAKPPRGARSLRPVRGGRVVAFEGDEPAPREPMMLRAPREARRGRMLGLLGGTLRTEPEDAPDCRCGHRPRTVVRLLAEPGPRGRGAAVVRLCRRCGAASLLR